MTEKSTGAKPELKAPATHPPCNACSLLCYGLLAQAMENSPGLPRHEGATYCEHSDVFILHRREKDDSIRVQWTYGLSRALAEVMYADTVKQRGGNLAVAQPLPDKGGWH